jgi:hypothetical protein
MRSALFSAARGDFLMKKKLPVVPFYLWKFIAIETRFHIGKLTRLASLKFIRQRGTVASRFRR